MEQKDKKIKKHADYVRTIYADSQNATNLNQI